MRRRTGVSLYNMSAKCDRKDCTARVEVRVSGAGSDFLKKLYEKGWVYLPRIREYRCPEHVKGLTG